MNLGNKLFSIALLSSIASSAHAESIRCTKNYTGSDINPAYQLRELTVSYQDLYPGSEEKILWNVTQIGMAQLSHELRQFFTPDGAYLYEAFPTNDKQLSLKVSRASDGTWAGAAKFTPARTPPAVDGLICEATDLPKFPRYCKPEGKLDLSRLMLSSVTQGDDHGVEQALLCGADANAKTSSGCPILVSALDPSCGRHDLSSVGDLNSEAEVIFNRLADAGAIIDARDPSTKETSLHKAVRQNLPDLVESLVGLEADVNAQDKMGNTPVMRAAEAGDLDLVTTVIDGTPDLKLKNTRGMTALDIAKRGGFQKLYALLSPNKKDGTGCDPDTLHIKVNEPAVLVLDATGVSMLRLISPSLNVNLMAEPNSQAKQIILPSRKGEFPFSCGLHGGNLVTPGKIIVE
jgi:hypothetical protein